MYDYAYRKEWKSSNRKNGGTRDTNVFIAEWVEEPSET